MNKVLELKNNNKKVGSIEIKNQTDSSADLFFYGDIVSEAWISDWYEDDMCPGDVQKFLNELENIQNINIHMNSGGGSCNGGIAIYNILKRYNSNITTYIDGLAASIASVIAMAGNRIIMPENALLMIHKPLTFSGGNADKLRKDAEVLDTYQKSILSIYMTKVKEGVTEEEINNMINKETWLTGKEAAQYFDIELEEPVNAVACISDCFNSYKNMPKDKINNIKNKTKQHILPVMDEATRIMIERIKNI
jgi:ATP-dependent protease ClpP protease subunit